MTTLFKEESHAAQGRNGAGAFPKIYVPNDAADVGVGVEHLLAQGPQLAWVYKRIGYGAAELIIMKKPPVVPMPCCDSSMSSI